MTVEEKQAQLQAKITAVEVLGKTRCPKCSFPYERSRFYRPYFICTICGHRWSENPVIEAMGTFLEELHLHGYPR